MFLSMFFKANCSGIVCIVGQWICQMCLQLMLGDPQDVIDWDSLCCPLGHPSASLRDCWRHSSSISREVGSLSPESHTLKAPDFVVHTAPSSRDLEYPHRSISQWCWRTVPTLSLVISSIHCGALLQELTLAEEMHMK